jgi:hypothetical protein
MSHLNLSKVNEAISETLYSTKITADESIIPVGKKTPEGEEILKEVSPSSSKNCVRSSPNRPPPLEIPETRKDNALKELVALAANCSQAVSQENC